MSRARARGGVDGPAAASSSSSRTWYQDPKLDRGSHVRLDGALPLDVVLRATATAVPAAVEDGFHAILDVRVVVVVISVVLTSISVVVVSINIVRSGRQ